MADMSEYTASPLGSVSNPQEVDQNSRLLSVDQLALGDPLLKLVALICSRSRLVICAVNGAANAYGVFVFALALYAVFTLGIGFVISVYHDVIKDEQLVTLYDQHEWPFALFIYLVAIPVVWAYYAWQPGAIANAVNGLAMNEVLARDAAEHWARAVAPIRRSRALILFVLAISASIAFATFYMSTSRVGFLFQETSGVSIRRWFDRDPWYFVIWLILVFIPYYLIAWMMFRHVYAIAVMRRLFATERAVNPRIFHPDRINGMSPLIDYVFRMTSFFAFGGVWTFILLLQTEFADESFEPQKWWFFLLVGYLLIVALALGISLWDAHLAMNQAKAAELEGIGSKIRLAIAVHPTQAINQNHIDDLLSRYRILDKEYREWPLPSLELVIPALIPVILFVGSFVKDLMLPGS